MSTDGGKTYVSIIGATKTTLSLVMNSSYNGYKVRAWFYNNAGDTFTDGVLLTVT
jgi:hypothetical protein